MKQLSQTPEVVALMLGKPREEAMRWIAEKRRILHARMAASECPGEVKLHSAWLKRGVRLS